MRIHAINRWNWSKRAEKWVYVEIKGGKRKYYYKDNPPQEFNDLVMKIKEINEKMVATTDEGENERLYRELMKISNKLQIMKRDNV